MDPLRKRQRRGGNRSGADAGPSERRATSPTRPATPARRASARDAQSQAAIDELRRLSLRRGLPEVPPPLAADMDRIARRLRGDGRRSAHVVAAWTQLVPAALLVRCRVDGIRAGTLGITVDGASTMWELDRLLREGAEARLRADTGGAIHRVRLRVGTLEGNDGAPRRQVESPPADEDM